MDNSSFFSVEHQCSVNVHLLPEEQPLPDDATFEQEIPAPFRLSSEVSHIDAASLRCLRNLGDASDELTNYLKMQAKKIDVILGYVLALQDDEAERHQTTHISAGGLSFLSQDAIDAGRQVRLKLFLTSEALAIYCYGEVQHSQALHDDQHLIEVKFNRLRETDQEHLIRATLHIQTQQLKQRQNS